MAVGEQVIQAKDGTSLHVTQFHCKDPKAQVLLVHGYLEHSLRYVEFAQALNKSNISVTFFDVRGHGSSGGPPGQINRWEDYLSDLHDIRTTLLPPNKVDTFLLGHSNGGLIVLDYILQGCGKKYLKGIKGAILTNPFLELPYSLANPIKRAAGKWLGGAIPSLPIPAGVTGDKVTSCPIKQEEHRNDPKNQFFARGSWACETIVAQARVKELAGSKSIDFPILYVIGEIDTVACPEINQQVAAQLKSEDKTILFRKGEKHEVINEVNREELYCAISQWVLDRSSKH